MKKIFFGILGFALLSTCMIGCDSSGNSRLSITLEGTDDSLSYAYISVASQSDRDALVEGMVGKGEAEAGKDTYNIPLPDDNNTYIVFARLAKSNPMVAGQQLRFFIFPGERVKVKGSVDPDSELITYKVSGSELLEAEQQHKKDTYGGQQSELEFISSTASFVSDSTRTRIMDRLKELSDSINQVKKEYILTNPDKILAGYYTLSMQPKVADSLYNQVLSDKVKNGPIKEMLDSQMKSVQGMLAAEKAREALVDGAPAPDFTLKTTDGKDFTLSSLYGKGKYTVLDFWGMWCGWCLKGFPEMKTIYEKYASTGKIEFVGINCGDTEQVWKDGVKEQGLPWINVYNGKEMSGGVPVAYGIQGYPTKFIIAPDGTIAARFVGETPDFYTKLEELVTGK